MFTLSQRLIVGCALLVAITLGLGLYSSGTLRRMTALDERTDAADRAVLALANLRDSLDREQLLDWKIAGNGEHLAAELKRQQQQTQQLFAESSVALAALDTAGAGKAAAEQQDWARALSLSPAQRTSTDAALLTDVQKLLAAETNLRVALLDEAARARATLLRRTLLAAVAGLIVSLLLATLVAVSVILPIRKTARSARRLGQGDLQQRIEWRSRDDLGTIGVELNRMAVRLRDLRETESGRKQMEYQLSDAVLQSIFEPIIVTDSKGHVLKLNQAAGELLGAAAGSRTALASTPGGEKILESVREAVSMQRAIANEGEAAILPMRIGQAQRSYRLRTTPMRDAESRLLGTVTVLEDVTEIQDTDRFKTRFLSIASNKLRGPLEKLRLSLYTLARGFGGELRPLQAELVGGAEEEAERLDDLMADLIEVSELDVGKRPVKLEKLRPINLLNDASDRFHAEASERQVTIEIHCFADLACIQGDKRALRSIFDNLIGNALRYTPAGGQIALEAEEVQDRIRFTIRDTGRGIESERLPNLFGRFNAASDEGTGLGLALVRRLVESLGGQIAVESRLGHGTSFRFTMPISTAGPSRHPVETG